MTPKRFSLFQSVMSDAREAWGILKNEGPGQIQFWIIALLIGIAAGLAALVFRKSIAALQSFLYGVENIDKLHTHAGFLPWYWVLLIPVVGGLCVGLILHHFTPDARVRSVADVIEGAALNEGRVEGRAGLASVFASLITLSSGGSSGREGPVVHLAAMISSKASNYINADGVTGRDLLGCAVAAAVSASFNAPIAGAIFAMEVVLRHFALHAFAPIVIASVAGTVISRLEFGNVTEYTLGGVKSLQFYVELPAFLLLGVVCGLVAIVLMRGIFLADDFGNTVQERSQMPRWLRPAISGALLGGLAIFFPHIIGVGYETLSLTLTAQLGLYEAVVFAVLKIIAVAITMAGRMGGGVFSPSLMVGAFTGLAYGYIATAVFPDVSSSITLYALAGMGAVAAAVMGAPISTTLIVFELTGDWQTALGVMIAVSISSALASRLVARSFFLTLIERRGIHLAAGPQAYLLGVFSVAKLMRPLSEARIGDEDSCWEMIGDGVYVDGNATLEAAMPILEGANHPFIPVVTLSTEDAPPELWGLLYHVDALKVYNKALANTAAEEHS